MRELTREEIDNAPEWATHYVIDTECDQAIYKGQRPESEFYYCWWEGLIGRMPYSRLDGDEKPIPRKQEAFDICQYKLGGEFSHFISDGDLFLEGDYCVNYKIDKGYSIALAKYFNLNAEDLK